MENIQRAMGSGLVSCGNRLDVESALVTISATNPQYEVGNLKFQYCENV